MSIGPKILTVSENVISPPVNGKPTLGELEREEDHNEGKHSAYSRTARSVAGITLSYGQHVPLSRAALVT